MHEPLLERIHSLEGAVRRWKLISLALLILLICGTAISGTFSVMVMLDRPGLREARLQEMMAREEAQRALIAEQQARQAAELARQQAQQGNQADAKAPDQLDP
jgi:hypothetical protein